MLIITDGKKWHYLAVKSLSALSRGIASENDGDFHCLICFHSYSTKNKFKKVKLKKLCLLEKMHSYQNNPEKSYKDKKKSKKN